MKKLLFYPAAVMAIVLGSGGCDYVALPSAGTTPIDTNSNVVVRKVLVEDYTGHLCTNCPDAADTLTNIEHAYGNKIVPLAVHCGFFAWPRTTPGAPLPSCASANPNSFMADYQTTLGTAWDNQFTMSATGLPLGMVNRTGASNNTNMLDRTVWKDSVYAILQRPADADIKITPTYNSSTRMLNVNVETKFLNALTSTNGFALSVVLTEDSVIDWQNVHGNCVQNYVFNHMLRGGISGNALQGTTLLSGNAAASQTVLQSYSNFSIDPAWNDNHCNVVAFVYNIDTWEVVQAEVVNMK